ncbi:MAG: hypothetical protein NVS4B6_32250 [Mycobacterium sp.]
MINGPFGMSWADPVMCAESRDGAGAGDHDDGYTFGQHLSADNHPQFTTMAFARLLCLRSHTQDGDRVPESLVLDHPERFGLKELDPDEGASE